MLNSKKDSNMVKFNNKRVSYDGNSIIMLLKEIDYILCSLHNIGSYYYAKEKKEYEKETTEFIDNSMICDRLAKIRYYLTSSLNLNEGEDGMDDIERACYDIPYWVKPGDCSENKWLN